MWIARDKDGSLWLYTDKPIKGKDMWVCEDFNNSKCLEISNKYTNGIFQLPEVTWENSPKELIIKTEENNPYKQ